jgi:hypothetical protein
VEDFDSPSGRDELHKLKGQNKDFDTEEEYMDIGGNTNSNILSDKTKVNEILSQGQFNASYPLSKNINLGMMFDGGFNNKHKLVDQYVGGTLYKKQDIVNNLYHLCNNIIEPLIDKGVLQKGQWRINSGFRQGNNSRSQHNKGQAVDIGIFGGNKFTKTFDIIKQIEKLVNYDQLILEYRYPNSCWIHISFNPKGNRKQAFTMINDIKTASGFSLISKIPSK